ncbi:unnamed protein product, partial [Medioppia subpectinata]
FHGRRFTALTGKKYGHISGLDPAGPGFYINDRAVRLDKSDAELVIISHSSSRLLQSDIDKFSVMDVGGFIGIQGSMGHYDFYFQGGEKQPGCEFLTEESKKTMRSNFTWSVIERIFCSHNKVTKYLLANQLLTDENSCQMIAYQCDSYRDFLNGDCSDCGPEGHKCRPIEFEPNYWSKRHKNVDPLNTYPNNLYIKVKAEEPY